jgi:predicted nuclease of predicted toxin-antitoxin system
MPAIRFLADESCDYLVVRMLLSAGHDVVAGADDCQRSVDAVLIDQAHEDGRILLTEDKDFGWHVFVARRRSPGVILIRFPAAMRNRMAHATLAAVEAHGDDIGNSFLVVEPGRLRLQRLPGARDEC